jgi:spore germination protein YaaH
MTELNIKDRKIISKKMILTGLIFSVILIASSMYFLLSPPASKERTDYFSGEIPIIYEGKQAGNGLMDEKIVYVPLDLLSKLDESIVYDAKSESVIFTSADKVVQMPTDSLTYFINEKPVQLQMTPLRSENNELYVALDPIIGFYPYKYEILDETNAILIQSDGEEIKYGKTTSKDVHEEKLRLRSGPGLEYPYTAQAEPGERLHIESEKGEYYLVRKETGVAGYMHKNFIIPGKTEKISVARNIPPKKMPDLEGPIHLTWEAVYTKNPDTARIPVMPGVNVMSPTWFHLNSADGEIKSLASAEYSNWARANGYHIWGLFSNAFDPELTHNAFKDFETRKSMIRQLLHYSNMYKLQGINLDIENVHPEDGPLITQFVREASPYFREAGLVLSIDVTFISESGNWSRFYERDKLAESVDYLAVMAYDEHWASSPVAGSVSSLPWVERNLENLLNVVPKEKLILGVPLYTRLWSEKETEDGTIEVSSKSLSMDQAKEWITENKVHVKYDPKSGQNFAEHYDETVKTNYKIWLEDELSLKKRAALAKKYDLAGIATWSRFFADSSAWTALTLDDEKTITKK